VRTSIPFELRGLAGRVEIEYLVNDDPDRWGYPVLGLESLVERSRGCPVVSATVEYPAEGYAAVMGWIQVVDHRAAPATESTILVDVAPQMHAVDAAMPYFAFGVLPAFFDAPSTTDEQYEFRAHAFLTASPDALMTPVVAPLCGFTWGYEVVGGEPNIAPLEPAGLAEWSWIQAQAKERYPAWTFLDLD
jgi:hypothetical protein